MAISRVKLFLHIDALLAQLISQIKTWSLLTGLLSYFRRLLTNNTVMISLLPVHSELINILTWIIAYGLISKECLPFCIVCLDHTLINNK